jgi:hypothetical protein
MDTLFPKVAGLDVHLKTIQCAVRCQQESGKMLKEVRCFGTMTRDLRALADYLTALDVTHVALESTGDSYLSAQYRRLAPRRGKKRALIAVGHSLLVIIYHVLKHKVEYKDLGSDYFDRLEPERLRRYLVKRLERLGYDVRLSIRVPDGDAA